MSKIIPTGIIGWKIIPVGTSMMCMVHNPVGVSGNTGRVDFEESCEVVDYQLKSGLEVRGQQNKNARMSVSEGWKLFEKNIPRAASCFWPHERICGRFRRYCSDVWGYMYIGIVHTHMHTVQDFQSNFYNRTVLLFLLQFLDTRQKKGYRKFGWSCLEIIYIFTCTVSTLKASW